LLFANENNRDEGQLTNKNDEIDGLIYEDKIRTRKKFFDFIDKLLIFLVLFEIEKIHRI